jgi:preprotein translocase subunit SecD
MKICWQRFNLYLLVALTVGALSGCGTPEERQERRLLSSLRLHLEAGRGENKGNEPVPVYREHPVMINIEREAFLTEKYVNEATVFEAVGGFALRIQFDHLGTTILDQYTVNNRGKRIAIFCQFGEDQQQFRWLAAPVISRRIADGVLVFTPDTTRQEAEEIAMGLNHVSKKVHSWIDK